MTGSFWTTIRFGRQGRFGQSAAVFNRLRCPHLACVRSLKPKQSGETVLFASGIGRTVISVNDVLISLSGQFSDLLPFSCPNRVQIAIRLLWKPLVVDAWADPELKKRLLKDPQAVLKKRGIALPEPDNVRVPCSHVPRMCAVRTCFVATSSSLSACLILGGKRGVCRYVRVFL